MADKQYVCVDVETTGLDPEKDEIVEVYARRFKEDGSLGKEFYQQCCPMSGIVPKEASNIHGITIEQVKDCPTYLGDGVQASLAEFIGERTVVGHNLIDFDIKFLKLKPREMEDTLIMCREKYSGGNNLKKACIRAGIKFDTDKHHGASYDVGKCIELYLHLKGIVIPVQQMDAFAQPVPVEVQNLFTQPYSFSRINLYHQCPFKWKKRYIEKIYEPEQAHLVTGSICHKLAERTSLWCYRETFANKFELFVKKTDSALPNDLRDKTKSYYPDQEVNEKSVGRYLFENPSDISLFIEEKMGLAHFISKMDQAIGDDPYEKASMPDLDTYNNLMMDTIRLFKCNSPDVIKDVEHIMFRFYKVKDFSNKFGQIALVEKQMAFDKAWKYLSDWKSDDVFFRGILDIIEYFKEYVVITDYKTSRTMLNQEQLKRDIQLKIYLLLLYKFLPVGSFKRVIVSIEYLRFGKTVEYEVENIEQIAKEAEQWIYDSIKEIESELTKDQSTAFKPKRNEYCYCCYLGDQGICPLFNRKTINSIDNIESFQVKTEEDCRTAWKRVETNKREIKNLTEKVKTFVKGTEKRIKIDENATLDFYAKEERTFGAAEVLKLLLKKGIGIKTVIPYFGISPTNVEKLINKNKVDLTEEEINQISKIKIKHEFDACTEEEAKANDYVNS